jgi:hypothetical protein
LPHRVASPRGGRRGTRLGLPCRPKLIGSTQAVPGSGCAAAAATETDVLGDAARLRTVLRSAASSGRSKAPPRTRPHNRQARAAGSR